MKSGHKGSKNQIDQLHRILLESDLIRTVLRYAPQLNLPDWYLGGGCIAQAVWNYLHGFDLDDRIKDYDLVYFDTEDLTAEREESSNRIAVELAKNLPVKFDIKNEARVHLWYENKFGYPIKPYKSIEDAIKTWPTTATSVAIRLEKGNLNVCAPFGLTDLFELIVRPNRIQITKDIYLRKVRRWEKIWKKLRFIPWEE
jgi:hypothetical protein